MHVIEVAGALTGILGVWLSTRQNVWCWPIGVVSVLLYVVVFREARLYATMGLQVVYVALALYGWWAWTRRGTEDGPLRVTRASPATRAVSLGVGLVASAALGLLLSRYTDQAVPFTDAAVTSFSLVAQWMQARKFVENWWVWLAVDAVYVGINLSQGLMPTAGLYVVYLGLALAGLIQWRRSMAAA